MGKPSWLMGAFCFVLSYSLWIVLFCFLACFFLQSLFDAGVVWNLFSDKVSLSSIHFTFHKSATTSLHTSRKLKYSEKDYVLVPPGMQGAMKVFELKDPETRLGRSTDCHIVLQHPSISGLHCRICRMKSSSGSIIFQVIDERFVNSFPDVIKILMYYL